MLPRTYQPITVISMDLNITAMEQASAKAQAVSVFQRFKEYQSHGGTDSMDDFLRSRGYDNAESVLNDPIYSGQIRNHSA